MLGGSEDACYSWETQVYTYHMDLANQTCFRNGINKVPYNKMKYLMSRR